jgi:hypothetical protein
MTYYTLSGQKSGLCRTAYAPKSLPFRPARTIDAAVKDAQNAANNWGEPVAVLDNKLHIIQILNPAQVNNA